MSLLYDADGDLIDLPAVSPTGEATVALWVYLTDNTTRQQFWAHGGIDFQVSFRGDVAGDPLQFFRQGATYGEATADGTNFAAYGLNKWLAVVGRAPSGTNATLWVGDESTSPAGPSVYNTQTALVTPTTTSGAPRIGNQTTTTRWIRGSVGGYVWWNGTALTDPQVAAWWADPFGYLASHGSLFATPTAFGRCGSNGTTDVPDETGNGNTGTITGLSSPDQLPYVLFPRTPAKMQHYRQRR